MATDRFESQETQDDISVLNGNIARKSKQFEAYSIPSGECQFFTVDDLIPSGFVPISVVVEQSVGTANAHVVGSLLKNNSGHWRASLYNYNSTTISVQPVITVWSMKLQSPILS